MKDLIFHLYIIENGLDEEKIAGQMERPQVAQKLQGLSIEAIIETAKQIAEEMNKKLATLFTREPIFTRREYK